MLTDIVQPVFEDAFAELENRVKQSQIQKGIRDRGLSANSLRSVVVTQGNQTRARLLGLSRFRFQQDGRGPNRSHKPSRQMVAELTDWATRHGMSPKAGYPIALKIAREGIRVPNPFNPGGVLSEPLGSRNVRELIEPGLRNVIGKQIRATLFGLTD